MTTDESSRFQLSCDRRFKLNYNDHNNSDNLQVLMRCVVVCFMTVPRKPRPKAIEMKRNGRLVGNEGIMKNFLDLHDRTEGHTDHFKQTAIQKTAIKSNTATMAKTNSNELSLCLTSRQGRKVVTLPASCTSKDLYDKAGEAFGAEVSALKYGFPPKKMDSDTAVTLSTVVQNQERIQVELGSTSTNGGTSTKKKATQASSKSKKVSSTSGNSSRATTASSTTTGGRPKRAAAKAATDSFADVIKAQDAIMASSQTKSQNKRKVGRAVNSASSSSPSKKAKPKPAQISAAAGDGRRLADGATVKNPRKRRAGQQQQQNPNASSDMSEALLGALDNKGKMGQVLRKGMKNAVLASYETSRAFSRLAAIQARTYVMEVLGESSLKVTFSGTVDKSEVKEMVDLIPRDVLATVLEGIHASNQEALRPENLSRLSPRVLWSLIHEYPDKDSIKECYESILPNLEWNFMRRRAQQLSEKAMENLRQEEEAKGENIDMDMDQASEAIHAVEHAMENLHAHESNERKARMARAALARQQQQDAGPTSAEWKLVTPSELDRDELLQCIESGPPSENDNVKDELVTKLVNLCQIHNWRELANVEDTNKIVTLLNNEISSEKVQKWIDHAQDESVDEIVVEICDGNTEHVERLTEKARTGTPKDLAAWRCIPESLLEQLGSDASDTITVDQLAKWTNRAHRLLQEFEWLNWYATPIE